MTNSDTPAGANRNSKTSAQIESDILRDLIYSYINDYLDTKPSNPTAPSSAHTENPKRRHQDESRSQLSLDTEMHHSRGSYNHEMACPRTPETSHCRTSGNSPDTSNHAYTSPRQTSSDLKAYVQILYQIQDLIEELHENLDPTFAQSQVLSSLLSTPSLEYRVVLREDHIHIRFRDGNHPEHVHSELILHRNFHSN